MLHVLMQARILELATRCYSSGLLNCAVCFSASWDSPTWLPVSMLFGPIDAGQDSRTTLLVAIPLRSSGQDSRTLPHISMQFRTIKLYCSFQCSSGQLNLATRSNAVKDSRTLPQVLLAVLHFRTLEPCYTFLMKCESKTFAFFFYAVQGSLTLLCLSMQFETLGPCYTFKYSSGPLNAATCSDAFKIPAHHVSMQLRIP